MEESKKGRCGLVRWYIAVGVTAVLSGFSQPYAGAGDGREGLSPEKALVGHWVCTQLDEDIDDHEAVEELHYYFSKSHASREIIFTKKARGDRGAPGRVVKSGKYRIRSSGANDVTVKIQKIGLRHIVFSPDRNSFTMEEKGEDFGEAFKYVDNRQALE
jgi:hypothetical protein